MKHFSGKKVLITGGSSGIGRCTALQLSQWGADVAIAARGENRLQTTLEEMRQQKVRKDQTLLTFKLDVADNEAVKAAVPEILAQLGGLDILINNAGITHPGYIQNTPDDVFQEMMRVNYFGTVNVTRAFLPHFMKQKSGHISSVSSLLGFLGIFGYAAYAASKFAITGFVDCLRQELLPHNVGVSVLFPGDTDTPQFHEENRIKPPETKAISSTVKVMPPEDVANVLLSGIASNKYHIVPGFDSKFTHFMTRHFPWAVRLVIDRDLRKYLAKNPKQPQVPQVQG